MEDEYIQRITTAVLLGVLVILSFLLVRPILLSIIFGILLAFVFTPIYNWLYKKTKRKNLSAAIICIAILLVIIVPIIFLSSPIFKQAISLYQSVQDIDFITPIKTLLPESFLSASSVQIGSAIDTFVTGTLNNLSNRIGNFILEIPVILLHLVVVFFTLFFTLRDSKKIFEYFQSLLPFPKKIGKDLVKSTKDVTYSLVYGQIIVGIIQGLCLSIGLFIFGVPKALLISIAAILMGILPMIGTAIVWVPLTIYLFATGSIVQGIGVLIFGILSSSIDNLIRPIIVSRGAKISPLVILVGMIGGLFFFGVLGLILGPLILAYLLVVLEAFRERSIPGFFISQPNRDSKSKATI